MQGLLKKSQISISALPDTFQDDEHIMDCNSILGENQIANTGFAEAKIIAAVFLNVCRDSQRWGPMHCRTLEELLNPASLYESMGQERSALNIIEDLLETLSDSSEPLEGAG
jgi:hypothetical protein